MPIKIFKGTPANSVLNWAEIWEGISRAVKYLNTIGRTTLKMRSVTRAMLVYGSVFKSEESRYDGFLSVTVNGSVTTDPATQFMLAGKRDTLVKSATITMREDEFKPFMAAYRVTVSPLATSHAGSRSFPDEWFSVDGNYMRTKLYIDGAEVPLARCELSKITNVGFMHAEFNDGEANSQGFGVLSGVGFAFALPGTHTVSLVLDTDCTTIIRNSEITLTDFML
jgi:hypothetical protein